MNIDLTPELEKIVESSGDPGATPRLVTLSERRSASLNSVKKSSLCVKKRCEVQIEEGSQAANRGDVVNGDEFFDSIDAELAAVERLAPN